MVLYEIALFEIQATPTKTPKMNKIKNQNIETITKKNGKIYVTVLITPTNQRLFFRRKCQ